MEMLQNFFDWFFALGSSVFVPFIMFTLCMVFKGGLSKSLRSALYMGVGLVGLGLIVDYSVAAMTPVTCHLDTPAAAEERSGVDSYVAHVTELKCSDTSWKTSPTDACSFKVIYAVIR